MYSMATTVGSLIRYARGRDRKRPRAHLTEGQSGRLPMIADANALLRIPELPGRNADGLALSPAVCRVSHDDADTVGSEITYGSCGLHGRDPPTL